MVSPTRSLHKISVHWSAKFYSESGLVDKRPFFLREPRIFWNGKTDIKSSKFKQCTIQPAKPKQYFSSKKSTNIVFENSAQVVLIPIHEAVGMLKPSIRSCPEKIVTDQKNFAVFLKIFIVIFVPDFVCFCNSHFYVSVNFFPDITFQILFPKS